MTRTVAQRVAADLAAEPRKHDWPEPGPGTIIAGAHRLLCRRQGCNWVWNQGWAEPTGCRGTDAS